MSEARRSFECFGGWAEVRIAGVPSQEPERAAAAAEAQLLDAHSRLSRFLPESELSRLNRDHRATVPASPLLLDLAVAAREAGRLSGGIVDATMLRAIEAVGYRDSLAERMVGKHRAAEPEPRRTRSGRHPAAPNPDRAWSEISVDRATGSITRPPGVEIDSGGIAKGLLADLVAAQLGRFTAFAIDCGGDVRIGGSGRRPRPVLVDDPGGGAPIHSIAIVAGGVATSGITRRRWSHEGKAAHHLLDPATGRPAFTGVVQATALAPTALLAEVHSKWALLSGPEAAPSRMPYGGVLVLDDGRVEHVAGRRPDTAVAA
ncbi:MAG: FAD:protein FMN transferase [Thermoleophilia bacterium]|nr:FAD:protein FMN transferase [Thermoleophilia bacterium]